jgi:hypothetical protein
MGRDGESNIIHHYLSNANDLLNIEINPVTPALPGNFEIGHVPLLGPNTLLSIVVKQSKTVSVTS